MPFWLSEQNKCNATGTVDEDEKDSVSDKLGVEIYQRIKRHQKTVPEEKCENTCVQMKINVRYHGKSIEADSTRSKFMLFQ